MLQTRLFFWQQLVVAVAALQSGLQQKGEGSLQQAVDSAADSSVTSLQKWQCSCAASEGQAGEGGRGVQRGQGPYGTTLWTAGSGGVSGAGSREAGKDGMPQGEHCFRLISKYSYNQHNYSLRNTQTIKCSTYQSCGHISSRGTLSSRGDGTAQ